MSVKEVREHIAREIGKVVVGQEEIVNLLTLAYLAGGHVLLEGVPGLAKTVLAKTMSKVIGKNYNRIQFTPDLMPADILGNNVYNIKESRFELKKGPVFTNILLADEINRASPKTQSALLEIMQEYQVTIDGVLYKIDRPFLVIATQNPIEFEGTYPLPEAQLDRFLMKIIVGYPSRHYELEVLKKFNDGFSTDNFEELNLIPLEDSAVKAAVDEYKNIRIEDSVLEYIYNIVTETRKSEQLILGASTRAAVQIINIAKISAAFESRSYVVPDDIKWLIKPLLRHRLVLNSDAEIDGYTADSIIDKIVQKVSVPR